MDNLPQSVPQEALPDQDFMEMVNRIEGKQKVTESPTSPSNDVIMVETPAGPVPLKKDKGQVIEYENKPPIMIKEPEEIKLEYRFSGDCPIHLIPISTLSATVDGKGLVFAYCEQCKKNIHSRTVPVLNPYHDEAPYTGYTPKRTFTRKKATP